MFNKLKIGAVKVRAMRKYGPSNNNTGQMKDIFKLL